jgi:hypothetical protein
MNNPERTFYVREITRKIDEQINSVRRELSNMLNIGIIKSDSKDNKIFYGVNKSYTFYAPLRKIFTSKELSAEKEDESAVWAKRFFAVGDVKLVVFAGKLVSGFDSDVDLLVVGNISKVKLRNLVKTIEEEQNIVISFAVMTYDDFYYRKSVQDKFITDIFDAKHLVVVDVNDVLNQEQQ